MMCEDLHSALQPLLKPYRKGQICIVADRNARVAVEQLCASMEAELPVLWLEVGETQKSLETVQCIWDFLFAQDITRRGLLICIGGGVLTDLGGFAAGTYKRGIDYINIPTTLLAMVDASVGGKTGFNYNGLKNAIGVFAQPVETLICPSLLSTLPVRQFLSGFGELAKTALLNHRLWPQVLQYDLDTMPLDALTPLIGASVQVKTRIVAADPHEEGIRKALNLGHTFGHALEEISLGELPHGYAVFYGLIAELYLSVTRLNCPREPLQQLTQIMLHYYGRPQCKCSDRDQLIALMQRDKKNERAAEINCTLLRYVGRPEMNQIISVAEAKEALDYLFSL